MYKIRLHPGLVVLLALAFGTGCANQQSRFRYEQVSNKLATGATFDAKTGAKDLAAATPTADCELRLFIEQRPSEGYYGTAKATVGVSVVERGTTASRFIDGVCVKRAGQELELPALLMIASPDQDLLERFCVDDIETGRIFSDPAKCSTSSKECLTVSACQWNGRFHSSRPFTFTLVSTTGTAVADFVELVRIFRNGDLMAAWNRTSDQPDRERIALGGNSLRSGFWAATLPPHLAAMDFRITPRGTELGDEIDLTVRDDNDLFRRRMVKALEAGADEALPKDSPARQSLDCLKQAVVHAHDQIKQKIRGKIGIPQLDPKCAMPLGLTYGTPLSDKYAALKDHTRDEFVKLKNDTEEELVKAREKLAKELPPAVEKALKEGAQKLYDLALEQVKTAVKAQLAKEPGSDFNSKLVAFLKRERKTLGLQPAELTDLNTLYETFGKLAKDVDTQVAFALRSVDEARALGLQLYEEARSIGTDTERQAQIFNAVATNLRDQGEVFEARRDNPAPLFNEQVLPMEYSDKWQSFMFAPWTGVPIRTSEGNAEADLTAAVAIPLLDVFGVRLQWGKSRFAEVRAAVGGGYTSTKQLEDDGTEATKSAFLPNASLGLGTFKIGVGYAVGAGIDDRFRLLIGADLLKLLSGSNVEAL